MGFPVVIVDTYGAPVIPTETGIPAELASNGFGTPVVLVDRGGLPMLIGGVVFVVDNGGNYLIDHAGRYLVGA